MTPSRQDVEPGPTGTLFVIAAASGTGKTSLVAEVLRAIPDITLSVSYTTRPPRKGEVDRKHYYFVDQARFDEMEQQDAFLEHACVFGQSYGTSRATVVDALQTGQDVLLEIDWQGAAQIRQKMPDCRSIFILPPSRATLLSRLRGRGQDSEAEITRRLAEAKEEMSHFHEFDYLVVNDNFETAVADLIHIFSASRLAGPGQMVRLSSLIEDLLS